MPKTKISDYSSTASNNTDVDGINIAEGMAPSNVNNAMREIMAHLKDWQAGNVAQDMKVDGAFTASGNAVLSADLSVGDDLTVTGDASVGGAFTCTGAAVLSSSLAVSGAATITGNLAANGTSSLGAATFSGAVVMSSALAANGNVTVGTSTTNSHTLNGNLTVGTSTSNTVTLNTLLSAGGGTGTSGQVLKSRGTANTPEWGTPIVAGTSQSASGTSVDFLLSSSVASYVKKISVIFSGISTNGTSPYIIQLGDSGGVETTGYLGSCTEVRGTPTTSTFTSGFCISQSPLSTNVAHGIATIARVDGNSFTFSVSGGYSDDTATLTGGGSKTLSDALDRIRLTTVNGTDTFDAGSVNVFYE